MGKFIHITKIERLKEAYRLSKRNGGFHGIDGVTFKDVDAMGRDLFLEGICSKLIVGTYKPQKNKRVDIPKDNRFRFPAFEDRVVQGALKLISVPILMDIALNSHRIVHWPKFGEHMEARLN